MYLCFIGESELASAFSLVGVRSIAVSDAHDALSAFRRVTLHQQDASDLALPGLGADKGQRDRFNDSGECGLLILTEDVADSLGQELVEWQVSGQYPLIVEVPSLAGHRADRKTLLDSIREAIGIRL